MAIYNEILSARIPRAIQKLFSMKGSPPVRSLAGDLSVSLPLFYGVENRYLEGWDRFANSIQQTNVAAQNGIIRHRNPAGSNVVAVFEKILYMTTAAAGAQPELFHGTTNTDLTTLVTPATGARLDPRGRNNPTVIESKSTAAGFPLTVIEIAALAVNTSYDFIWYENQEIPLLPGDALDVGEGIVNQTFTCSFVWRERPLEDSEKT